MLSYTNPALSFRHSLESRPPLPGQATENGDRHGQGSSTCSSPGIRPETAMGNILADDQQTVSGVESKPTSPKAVRRYQDQNGHGRGPVPDPPEPGFRHVVRNQFQTDPCPGWRQTPPALKAASERKSGAANQPPIRMKRSTVTSNPWQYIGKAALGKGSDDQRPMPTPNSIDQVNGEFSRR
jgi:hypothetical protein